MTTKGTAPHKVRFGIKDYWSMYRARGFRLPLCYFLNAHLFDLIHKTDTHIRIQKEEYEQQPPNLDHGTFYMSSWTEEIKKAFKIFRTFLGDRFQDYTFLDIGCGKGKAVLVWEKERRAVGLIQRAYGIDYYEPFIKAAQRNHQIMFGSDGTFFFEDATQADFSKYGKRLMVYFYNPFDSFIMEKVLDRLLPIPSIIIYNNPVLSDLILRRGYRIIHKHQGFHANAETTIYSNHSL